MTKVHYIPRDAAGRLHPSATRRRKVLYRCTSCGWDLVKHEVRLITRSRIPARIGTLMHSRRGQGKARWCGPVMFAENPLYRKQAN